MTIKQILLITLLAVIFSVVIIFGFIHVTGHEAELSNDSLEAINHTKGILVNDYDLDGLNNSQEKKLGTDPYQSDTDNDGFSDKYEIEKKQLNPLQKDMRLEVDYEKGTETTNFTSVVDMFDEAPISNPDGTTGINLHIETDEKGLELDKNYSPMKHRLNYSEHYDKEKQGYYHVLVTDNPTSFSGASNGFQMNELNSFVVRDFEYNQATLSRLLAFNMGMNNSLYDGINSRKKSCEEYFSVLNNNCLFYNPDYSIGGEFDDWQYINQSLSVHNPINNPSDPIFRKSTRKQGDVV